MKQPLSTSVGASILPGVEVDRTSFMRRWLYLVAVLVLVRVVLAVITRLDHAGPLLEAFVPISSALPPMTEHGWRSLFDLFQRTPGFSLNEDAGMTLARFEFLYLWEWAHGLAGYAIDVALALGFVALLARKEWRTSLRAKHWLLAVVGLAHASLGPFLSSAGLLRRADLAQFAVAVNVASASVLFAWCIWFAADAKRVRLRQPRPRPWIWAIVGLVALAFTQTIVGAFVAGLRAGAVFNTWPLMDGAFIPDGLWFFSPWWKNLVENALTVEVLHRLLGYVIFVYAVALLVVSHLRRFTRCGLGRPAAWIFGLVLVQACLGVGTVLSAAAIPIAAAHAAAALLLIGFLAAHFADVTKVPGRVSAQGGGNQR